MTSPPFAFGRCRGHVFSLPPGAASSRWPRSARNWHGKISGTSGGHFWRTDNIRFANRVRLINRSFRPKTFCSNVQRQTGMLLFRGNHNPGFRMKFLSLALAARYFEKENSPCPRYYCGLVESGTGRQTKCI